MAAFSYGVFVVHSQKPAFLVFAYNQFHVVTARDYEGVPAPGVAASPRYGVGGPLIVFARPPASDPGGIVTAIGAIFGDPTQARLAKNYEAFPHSMSTLGRETLQSDDVLPYLGTEIERHIVGRGRQAKDYYYFRVVGRIGTGIAVVDPANGELVGLVAGDLNELSAKGSQGNP